MTHKTWFVVGLAAVILAAVGLTSVLPCRAKEGEGPSQKARLLSVAREGYRLEKGGFEAGTGEAEDVVRWSLRLLQAGRLDAVHPESELRKRHLDRMVALEIKARAKHQQGTLSRLELLNIEYHRVEAELWVRGVKTP